MAEIKIQGETISQRPEKARLDGAEYFLLQDSEGTKSTKAATLKTFAQPDLSDYAKKNEIPDTNGLLSVEEAERQYQPKGDYLTEVPDGYVTEQELEEKGYETSSHASQTYATKTDLASKVSGSGVTAVQVVESLPESQTEGVLYIVTGKGGA